MEGVIKLKYMFKSLILPTITLLLFTSALNAQKQRFIIIRHAEKDTTISGSQMMQADPPLSSKGQERAQSLISEFRKYKIIRKFGCFLKSKITIPWQL